jgi:biopolymer transport protein TolR
MGMSVRIGRRPKCKHQRHAADRRAAGAADHLYGDLARKPKGLDALVPQPPPPNAPKNVNPDRTIVVQLIDRGTGSDPGLKINNEDATWDNLQGRLTDIYKQRAEKVMFVKGDDAIAFAKVANVIDIAHAAGVDKVGLITAKIEAGN